jgi:hypothetical protein
MSSIIKTGFCNKLIFEFDSRMNQLIALEQQLDNTLKSLKIGIASITGWNPDEAIYDFEKSVDSHFVKMVPDLSTFDELVFLVNACVFTKNDPMLKNPSTIAKSIKNSVKDNAVNILNSLASVINAEFSVSTLLSAFKKQITDNKIGDIIEQALQILNCISAICGIDITSRLHRLQYFMNKYSISVTGEVDIVEILNGEDLDPSVIQSIKRVNNKVENIMKDIDKSFTLGTSMLKKAGIV